MSDISSATAQRAFDALSVPALVAMLAQAGSLERHIEVIRALGRRRDPAIFPALLPYLDQDMRLRASVIEAMGDLRDRRAIPHLLRFLPDRTDAPSDDNFSPRWRIADVTQAALLKIEDASLPEDAPSLAAIDDIDILPATRRSFWPFVPLCLAILALPWAAMIIFAAAMSSDEIADSDQTAHRLDAIAAAPAIIGLVITLAIAATNWPRGLIERFCLLIGGICCAAVTFSFGWEFFH